MGPSPGTLAPSVGDVLRISVFRNVAACRDEFTATNTRTRNTKRVTVRTPCRRVYRHAQPGAILTDISGTWSPPAANVLLWSFQLQRHPRHDLRPVADGETPGGAGDHGADGPL